MTLQKWVNDPKFPGNDPKFPGNDPKFPGNDPKFPGNDPTFLGNDPKFLGNDPIFQASWRLQVDGVCALCSASILSRLIVCVEKFGVLSVSTLSWGVLGQLTCS